MGIWLLLIFILGYLAITLEHPLRLDKSATALLMAVLCWVALAAASASVPSVTAALGHHLQGAAEILFFLLGAMSIVEVLDAHQAFTLVTDKIRTRRTVPLLWLLGIATFLLSAVLDNLTTAIVMATLLRRLVAERHVRWVLGGAVIIAANAGGAFSPMGDVTTTMLWIGGQVSVGGILLHVLLPSLVCFCIPLWLLGYSLPKALGTLPAQQNPHMRTVPKRERTILLAAGFGALLFVPVFKAITGLPPYLGMLFGLGVVWVVCQVLHRKKTSDDRTYYSAAAALSRTDTPSILFFLGILLAVGALEHGGWLGIAAKGLQNALPSHGGLAYALGLCSAVIDNVPLVAAAQGMFGLQDYPQDHPLWLMLAYAAGTGGSILIIGSAAGVAVMGIEQIPFGWYLRRVAGPALLGYTAGMLVFLLV